MNKFNQVAYKTFDNYTDINGGVLDVSNDFGYWLAISIDFGVPHIIKVRLSTMELVDALPTNDSFQLGLNIYGNSLFATGPTDSLITVYNLEPFSFSHTIDLSSSHFNCIGGMGTKNNLLYLGGSFVICGGGGISPNYMLVVNMATEQITSYPISNSSLNSIFAFTDNYIFGSYNSNSTTGIARMTYDFKEIKLIPISTPNPTSSSISSAFIYNGYVYCGQFGQGTATPLSFHKVSMDPFELVDTLTVPEQNSINQFVDNRWGYLYYTTFADGVTTPDGIARINLNTFKRDYLQMPQPDMLGSYTSGRVDTINGYAYFGSFNSNNTPDTLYKYDIGPTN